MKLYLTCQLRSLSNVLLVLLFCRLRCFVETINKKDEIHRYKGNGSLSANMYETHYNDKISAKYSFYFLFRILTIFGDVNFLCMCVALVIKTFLLVLDVATNFGFTAIRKLDVNRRNIKLFLLKLC